MNSSLQTHLSRFVPFFKFFPQFSIIFVWHNRIWRSFVNITLFSFLLPRAQRKNSLIFHNFDKIHLLANIGFFHNDSSKLRSSSNEQKKKIEETRIKWRNSENSIVWEQESWLQVIYEWAKLKVIYFGTNFHNKLNEI